MYKCDCCGLCCMHVDNIGIDVGLNRGDGICFFFNESAGLCDIYENRPIICNVDKFYDMFLQEVLPKDEYYRINEKSCEVLKSEYRKEH